MKRLVLSLVLLTACSGAPVQRDSHKPQTAGQAGLAAFEKKDWYQAATFLDQALQTLPEDADRPAWLLALADSRLELGDREEARRLYFSWLEHPQPCAPEVLAGFHIGAGRMLLDDREFNLAEQHFVKSEDLLLEAVPLPEIRGHELAAKAFFYHGLIYQELAQSIKLKLPVERMGRDLSMKRSLFKKGEELLMLSVRIRHQVYSVRSGYVLGFYAERFGRDLLAAEVPADMSDEERRIYFAELSPYVLAVQEEALDYYVRTERLAKRLGFTGQWVDRVKERKVRLQGIIRKAKTAGPRQ